MKFFELFAQSVSCDPLILILIIISSQIYALIKPREHLKNQRRNEILTSAQYSRIFDGFIFYCVNIYIFFFQLHLADLYVLSAS